MLSKSILITGANGYIATQIYPKLQQKYTITKLTRQDCDLRDYSSVKSFFQGKHFDVVIHTATQGGSRLKEDDGSVCYYNLLMFNNLMRVKQDTGCYDRLINFSSGAQLDQNMRQKPYGLSKSYITSMAKNFSFVTTVRIWNVFNQNELETRFIKSALTSYINRQPIVIHKDRYFDFFHIDDLVEILGQIIEGNHYYPYYVVNCSYSIVRGLVHIANIINHFGEYKVPVVCGEKREDDSQDYVCKDKAQRLQYDRLWERLKQCYNKLKEKKNVVFPQKHHSN